jgi:histidine triad (HIT) family protein
MTDCIFCRIVSGEIPAQVVRRTKEMVAFRDLNPQAPTHVLVVPATHYGAARDATGADGERMLGRLVAFSTDIARELGLDDGGYRIVTNTGRDGGQSVGHLHLHLLGGRAMGWPPG